MPGIRAETSTRAALWSWNAPGVWGIVLIALIVLKLTGVITWSWWWVLPPMWISGTLAVLRLCVLAVLVYWEGRRLARSWMDQFMSGQWLTGRAAGLTEADASGGDLGFQDER